jgi:hypothetical protein
MVIATGNWHSWKETCSRKLTNINNIMYDKWTTYMSISVAFYIKTSKMHVATRTCLHCRTKTLKSGNKRSSAVGTCHTHFLKIYRIKVRLLKI